MNNLQTPQRQHFGAAGSVTGAPTISEASDSGWDSVSAAGGIGGAAALGGKGVNPPIKAAQFAITPHAVTTTVVTTTTTKITEFPPLFLDRTPLSSQRSLKTLNVHEFPLANTPTPPALKRLCFDINGVPTRLSELDLHETDLAQLNVKPVGTNSNFSASIISPRSIPHFNFQQHTQNVTPFNSVPDMNQTNSPQKFRKRDNRGAAFANNHNIHHQTTPQLDDPDHDMIPVIVETIHEPSLPDIPLTPFPDPALSVNINNISAPLITPLLPVEMDFNNEESTTNLPPSPTMSPTHSSLPAFTFFNNSHNIHQQNFQCSAMTSPTPRRHNQSAAASSGIGGSNDANKIPNSLLTIPTMIHAYDSFPPQLQSYILLNLLRRTPSRTLQFVSTLVLPALKRDFLTDLPAELAYAVLARLDLRTLARCARVCRGWRGVVDGEGAEIAVWKRRLVKEGWLIMDEVAGLLESLGVGDGEGKGKGKEKEAGKLRIYTGATKVDLSSDGCGRSRKYSGGSVDDEVSEDNNAYDYDNDDNESEENSGPFYEFAEDAEEDEENCGTVDGIAVGGGSFAPSTSAGSPGAEFSEYFSALSPTLTHDLVKKTAEWMRGLDEFATGISENEGTNHSHETSTFRRGTANRMKISQVRARLRAYIQCLSKAELGRLALQIPNIYKGIYRRHHIVRRNWAKGKFNTIEFPGHGQDVVTCLQFDSDKIVSGSDDQSIHIYDTKSGRLRRKLIGHDGGVWALQYWGDSLVSGSTDRTVRVWDIDTGLCTHLFEGHTSTVRCLMIVTPSETTEYPFGTNGKSGGVGFHAGMEPSQPLIVTGSRDASLRVWRLPNPKSGPYHVPVCAAGAVHALPGDNTYNSPEGNPHFMHVLNGHTNSVRAIAGHGRVLVSGSYDCTVRVWDLLEGECIYTFRGHREKVYSVGYSHELSRAVSGSLDASVKVWCTRTGVLLHSLEGHTSLVGLLELSPSYLVSAAADHSLRIWAPDSGACLAYMHGHPAAITCFHHDPKLNRIVSGSDGGIKLWEMSSAATGGINAAGGPGFEVRQGPNGPEPVYGRFTRDLVSDIAGVWRVRMDERRLVCAVSKEGGSTWFRVLDFGESTEHGRFVEGLGDGGGGVWEDDDDEDDEDGEDGTEEHGEEDGGDNHISANHPEFSAANNPQENNQRQQHLNTQLQPLPPSTIFQDNQHASFGETHHHHHMHGSSSDRFVLPPPPSEIMYGQSMPQQHGSNSILFSTTSSLTLVPSENFSNTHLPDSWNTYESARFERNSTFGASFNNGIGNLVSSSASGIGRGKASLQEIVDDVDEEDEKNNPPAA
ncbi:SCF ubiquitin ligase complex subunit cdc4 [Physocladia obscura]|uniref:SCF ubiquitin ligase complex subunit cdc4 n=1 Tax=Physocladia obscura TaxID=109957 RepID=A0AAD5XDV0_9FUNG|nr:SCF ubiquitin ligase complex subunit cdc4 [Physocladia obscura]